MSWHQLIIVGNLGDEPTLRYLDNGTAICNFSVAVTERWKDRNSQQQERTTWYQISAFAKLAENCNQFLAKGRQVMVIGTPSARPYQRRDGQAAASLDVRARQVQFIGDAQRRQQQESFSPGGDIPY